MEVLKLKPTAENSKAIATTIQTMFIAYGKGDDCKRQLIYIMALEGLPSGMVNASVHKLLITNTFLPSISEIYQSAKDICKYYGNSNYPTWDEVLMEINKAIQNYGLYRKPKFSCDAVEYIISCYGWINLCNTPDSQIPFVYSHLHNLYEQYCRRKNTEIVCRYVLTQSPIGCLQSSEKKNGDFIQISEAIKKLMKGLKDNE